MRSIVLVIFLTLPVNGQSFQRCAISFSAGISRNVGQFQQDATPLSLGATGGLRVTPFIELEASVFGAINPVKPVVDAWAALPPIADLFGCRSDCALFIL